MSSLKNSETFY